MPAKEERMLGKMTTHLAGAAIILSALCLTGCRQQQVKATMEVAELNLQMELPSGWRVDPNDPRLAVHGAGTIVVTDEPLDGQSFAEKVETLITELTKLGRATKITSKTPLTISGCEAVEVVAEHPDAGSQSIRVYIHNRDRVIEVSAATSKQQFQQQQASLRRAFQSIRIR
jgi:uncharacterized protein YcfL